LPSNEKEDQLSDTSKNTKIEQGIGLDIQNKIQDNKNLINNKSIEINTETEKGKQIRQENNNIKRRKKYINFKWERSIFTKWFCMA